MNNIEEKVIRILSEQLEMPEKEINLSSTQESLGMDSLDRIEVIMALEEVFDMEISDHDAERFTDVKSVVDYLTHRESKSLLQFTVLTEQDNTYLSRKANVLKHFDFERFSKAFRTINESSESRERVREENIEAVSIPEDTIQKAMEISERRPIKSDGGDSKYYHIGVPQWFLDNIKEKGYTTVEDIAEIVFKNDANFFNVFKAQCRMFDLTQGGGKEGNTFEYDATKCKYYVDKQVEVFNR